MANAGLGRLLSTHERSKLQLHCNMYVQQLLLQFVFQGIDFFDGLVIYDFVEYRRRQVQSQAMITDPP